MNTTQVAPARTNAATVVSTGTPRGRSPKAEVKRILGLSVPLTVIVAERDMAVEAILAMKVGTIIEFDVMFDSDLILHIAKRPIAVGQAIKVGENFGLRISEIDPVSQRIDAMGAGSSTA